MAMTRLVAHFRLGVPVFIPLSKGEPMRQKIVLRMRDGAMEKCSIYSHFSVAYRKLKVLDTEAKLKTVDLSEVKAIFFVREHEGSPGFKASKEYTEDSPKAGKAVKVTFADGEVLRGKVLNLAEGSSGFFLFPPDPLDNNLKIFVVRGPGLQVEEES